MLQFVKLHETNTYSWLTLGFLPQLKIVKTNSFKWVWHREIYKNRYCFEPHPGVTDVIFEFCYGDDQDKYVLGLPFREDIELLFVKFPNFVNFTIPTIYLYWIILHPEAVDVFSEIFKFPIKSFQIGTYCTTTYSTDMDYYYHSERHQYRRERELIDYGDRGLESEIKASSKFP